MNPTEHLATITEVLNAALEHCPPATQRLLGASVQAHVTALRKAIQPAPQDLPPGDGKKP